MVLEWLDTLGIERPLSVCIGCVLCAIEGGHYICLPSESNGPNLLDETFERLHCQRPLEGG